MSSLLSEAPFTLTERPFRDDAFTMISVCSQRVYFLYLFYEEEY